MSGGSGAVPAPYVLDASVLTAVARADRDVMTMIQRLDANGQPLVIPVLAMAGAALDTRDEEAYDLLAGLERLKHTMTAPLRDAEQATTLADVIARTELGPWDAHVAAIADAAVCPILTIDGATWRQHAGDLDEPLHIIEVIDPE